MVSKYAAIMADLPRAPREESEYQERVNLAKASVADGKPIEIPAAWAVELKEIPLSSSGFAAVYAALKDLKDNLEEREKVVNLWLEAIGQMLVDSYEVDDTTSLTLASGGAVRSQPEVYSGVADREAFQKWCIANGYMRELQMPWSTMNAITKARLEKGEPEPDGVKAWVKTKPVYSRPKR